MRLSWLNLILKLSNQIYQRKQLLVGQEGMQIIGNIVSIVLFELFLAVVSLPLYMGVGSQKVTAFFEERGGYAKVGFDYKLRRILTLSGTVIIAAVWALKLLLILLVPSLFGPLPLYSVSNLRPPELSSQEQAAILEEAGIQNARAVQSLQRPEFTGVKKISGKNFVFSGTGEPNTMVVLFLTDQQTAVYTGTVDKSGMWSVEHGQKEFVLSEGNHSLSAFTYNKQSGVRSDFSNTQYFKVKTTWLDFLVRNVDVVANLSVVTIILLGAFLVVLTI